MSSRPKRFTTSSTIFWTWSRLVTSQAKAAAPTWCFSRSRATPSASSLLWGWRGARSVLCLLELARHSLALFLALGVDDVDVTALCSQCMADALAKPAIAAGDDGDCPFQGHAFLPFKVGGSLKPVLMGGNHYDFSTKLAGKPDGGNMGRKYDVIDADGHVLEPFTLWNDYMDPQYRERAPKLVKDDHGKERLLLEDKILGSRAGFGGSGGVGARQGVVAADAMEYKDGRKGGFDPHARIPDMDLDGI